MSKNETKNTIRAKLLLMLSLAKHANMLGELISNTLTSDDDDAVFDLLDTIQTCETTEIKEIMSELEDLGCFKELGIEEGEPVAIPYIHCKDVYSLEVGVQYPSGEKLAAYVSESDTETLQAGSILYTADNTPVDLAMAEIKKGELAKTQLLPEDNKDIDVYVWSDVNTEDYTHNFRLQHADILQALEESQEEGEDNK